MESKWYFFPGQTPANTKISDRAHALHITKPAWANITEHLNRKKRIQEAIDKEKAHKEALKQGSEAMTKEWVNSIENLRIKKEEERRDRINKKKEDKIQMFYKMRAEQEVVRKEYVEKVKREVFRSTGYPKELTSALMLSETLYEREKQKEFNEMIKKHEEEIKKEFHAQVIARDEKDKKEDEDQKLKRFEERKKVSQILKNQIVENETMKKAQSRARIEKETIDRINAAREEELLKEFEREEKLKTRREIALEKKKEIAVERKRQELLAKETAEMEKATEFYSEAKKRIDCLLKLKEKEMREEAIKAREALASKVGAIQEAKDAAEDERIAKAVAERDEEERAKVEAKAIIEAQAVKERIEDRKQFLERHEREKCAEREVKRWEMLNRVKTQEALKEYEERAIKERWERILEYRRELLEQMAEEKEVQKKEKEIEEIMSRVSFEEADKMFFDYAEEVMDLAKKRKRSTYPIEKVITEYKKINNLMPKDRHCRCCKK
ncbi:trichohyalin-like [Tribolium madens]|uniref:trichohyalin-like n=1 Tax=Tribolium madens TaxID=41895 RepID=UPI001CF7293A|nr:trichohyalin-like [Tribolium madens]